MSKNVEVFQNFEAPKEEGVYYRLLCLNGRTKGASYFLMGKRIIIGRADTADIQVFDIKSSREHAEVSIVGRDVIVTDLGSQNGITVNDLKVKQHKLKDGDKVIVGQTVFKFGRVKINGPKKKEVIEGGDADELETSSKRKNPIVLVIIVAAVAYYFLMGDSENSGTGREREKNKSIFKAKVITDDFSSAVDKKRFALDKETALKLKVIFQLGLREYQGHNYFRSMNEFKKALIVKPDDAQANFYLRKAKDALDDMVKKHFNKGDRDFGSLKYSSAQVEYCAIIRTLHNYPEHEDYKAAEKKIKEIENKLGMDSGEIKCLKK
jgi:pSer/pThr/pTyr-binding forkhead associated (FHA) protein